MSLSAPPLRAALSLAARPGTTAALMAAVLLAPSVSLWPAWGDALEFTAGAPGLAILHPTGYPLQSLLAKVVAELPVSSLARRMNALSWVAMAVAAAAAAEAAWVALRAMAPPGAPPPPPLGLAWTLATAFGVLLAAGPTGRELGTTAELYALHLAFQGTLLALALHIAVPRPARRPPAQRPGAARPAAVRLGRPIAAAALLGGVALTHHRMAALAVGLAFLAAAARWSGMVRRGSGRTAVRSCATAFSVGLLGLTPWLFLPLRAAGGPLQNWGDPSTPERFVWVARGGEFVEFHLAHLDPARAGGAMDAGTWRDYAVARTALVREWAARELVPPSFHRRCAPGLVLAALLVAAAAGAWTLARVAILLGLLPLAGWGGALALVFVYRIVDPNGYLLSMAMFAGLLATAGIAAGLGAIERAVAGAPLRGPWLALLMGVGLWASFHAREPAETLLERGFDPTLVAARAALAERYAHRLADALAPDALLLAEGDNPVFAAWYFQYAQGQRPDVLIVGASFLKEAWYAAMLAAQPSPLASLRTGGGTPGSAREYADRLVAHAVRPALRAGRPAYFLGADPAVVARLGEHLLLEPAAELLSAEERALLPHVYPLPPPAHQLWRLSPR